MDRLSRVALSTLTASACAVASMSGCANILGFKDFSDDGGVSSDPQGSSNDYASSGSSTGSKNGGSGNASNAGGGTSSRQTNGVSTTSSGSTGAGSTAVVSSSQATSSTAMTSSSAPGTPGPCTFGTAYNGDGSFTWYYFGQGTYVDGNNDYKTACGYTEPKSAETSPGSGATDTISNVANTAPAKNTYFAAIPGASDTNFDTVTSCGACVEITGQNGNKIVATIIDECPLTGMHPNSLCTAGHLDLSTQAFQQLGYGNNNGSPTGTTWKYVACPVTGNIQAVNNASGQVYLQNSVYPISAVNGQAPTTWGYFNVGPGNAMVTSSVVNETITINIPANGGDTGGNFTPPTGGCY